MPRYRIEVRHTQTEIITIEVTAHSENRARVLARHPLYNSHSNEYIQITTPRTINSTHTHDVRRISPPDNITEFVDNVRRQRRQRDVRDGWDDEV